MSAFNFRGTLSFLIFRQEVRVTSDVIKGSRFLTQHVDVIRCMTFLSQAAPSLANQCSNACFFDRIENKFGKLVRIVNDD